MQIKEILINTPWWVWALFVYLVYRGISLLSPNQISPQRMLIMPCIFLIWSVYGIFNKLHMPWLALLVFAIAIVAGLLVGRIIMQGQPAATKNVETGMIHRAGSVIPLIIILVNFSFQYIFNNYAAFHPNAVAELNFIIIYSAICGLADGLFWGVFVTNLTKSISRKKVHSVT